MLLTGTQGSSRRESRTPSSNSDQKEATTIEVAQGKTVWGAMLTGPQESGGDGSIAHQKEAKPIEIDGRDSIYAVAFLADGKHIVSGGDEGKMRRWRVEDGRGVGRPVDVGSSIVNIAVSQDEKWVVKSGDGVECGEPRKSERVESTQQSGTCSRRLTGWDGISRPDQETRLSAFGRSPLASVCSAP
jgi:hypothetical protein